MKIRISEVAANSIRSLERNEREQIAESITSFKGQNFTNFTSKPRVHQIKSKPNSYIAKVGNDLEIILLKEEIAGTDNITVLDILKRRRADSIKDYFREEQK